MKFESDHGGVVIFYSDNDCSAAENVFKKGIVVLTATKKQKSMKHKPEGCGTIGTVYLCVIADGTADFIFSISFFKKLHSSFSKVISALRVIILSLKERKKG